MSKIKEIILHCSDSEHGCASIIRQWHLARGWKDIGYHFVIPNGHITPDLYIPSMDGCVEVGRVIDGDGYLTGNEIGAHALGHNADSLGICMIGVKSFTTRQLSGAARLITGLMARYGIPIEGVIGHYETESGRAQGKTCPNIDMDWFRANLYDLAAWRMVPGEKEGE